jgi:hypothetical protein
MGSSLHELFGILSQFRPPSGSLSDAPWEQYVDWAISQGLAPLAAYNLEYRLGGAGAPEWAHDRLLSVYQGSVNDTVMKLVTLKRALGEVTAERFIVLGGASFAEALYPHVAFRPLLDIRLLVAPAALEPVTAALRATDFRPEKAEDQSRGATVVLSDGRTPILLFSHLLGTAQRAEEEAMIARALPIRVFGPSAYRLDLEDAVLALCLEQARAGYQVPTLSFLDLRELLLGSPSTQGPYSRPPDWHALHTRAARWRVERALYASASIVERLFPDAAPATERAKPPLKTGSRKLLERLIVAPVSEVGKTTALKGAERLRRLVAGG